jgi:WNK lysine deficient protein kinase
LITEIVLLKNIDHSNIIKYYGYSEDNNGNFLIITELMKCGCLSDYLKGDKKLTLLQKYNILYDVCKGMIFLHSQTCPIVHRGKSII